VRRTLLRILCGLLLVAGVGAAARWVPPRILPEDLRVWTEARLSQALGSPVSIESTEPLFRLGLGFGIEGHGVEIWPREEGRPSLVVRRARARVDLLSLLLGRFRLDWIILDGARFEIARDARGRWSPPPFQSMADEDLDTGIPHPEELLNPLIEIEGFARWLLREPYLADTFDVRSSELVFVDGRPGSPGEEVRLEVQDVSARLRHRRVRGDARLTLTARLQEGGGELTWEGSRSHDGEVRLQLATDGLDVAALAPYLRAALPEARLDGRLAGEVNLATPRPGDGRLRLDWVLHDLSGSVPAPAELGARPLEARRAEVRVDARITPERARIENARVASGGLALLLRGAVERPLRPESRAGVVLAFRDVELARLRDLVGWLPAGTRRTAAALFEPLEAGRLGALRVRGADTLAGWQALLAGRTAALPHGFAIEALLDDARVRVSASDHLEEVSGRLRWEGDRLRVDEARAWLSGAPLPQLDLVLDGVSHFFAEAAQRREIAPGTEPLVGLSSLWSVLAGGETAGDGPEMRTVVRLELETVQHPMFFWPIDDVQAEFVPRERGVFVDVARATWAGVPIRGEAEWLFEPRESLRVALTAAAPRPEAPAPGAGRGWARGRFAVGALEAGDWRQRGASGGFRAVGGRVVLDELQVELVPRGRVAASGVLDLDRPDEVPFELAFTVEDGDVAALGEQLGLAPGLAEGTVEGTGAFEGRLAPERSLFRDLHGALSVEARDGLVRRKLPPVVAVALASRSFNPFSSRDLVRFDTVETRLTFEDGAMRTEQFRLDGPDLRVLASGQVQLARAPHELDAEVALFLFRQVDRAFDKIPVLNVLVLGTDQHLATAYFELEGPWDAPRADLVPLRSLGPGPAGLVLESVPNLVRKGLRALGSVFDGDEDGAGTGNGADAPEPGAALSGEPRRPTPRGS